ncbi:hypothetical protein VNO77_23356 [Canavalia gladiata]|uniref:Uncharacterized protein n=1 Tax=Canavalia gladiata TaxID=3824 RepID=A0AAN9L546_CANGL
MVSDKENHGKLGSEEPALDMEFRTSLPSISLTYSWTCKDGLIRGLQSLNFGCMNTWLRKDRMDTVYGHSLTCIDSEVPQEGRRGSGGVDHGIHAYGNLLESSYVQQSGRWCNVSFWCWNMIFMW